LFVYCVWTPLFILFNVYGHPCLFACLMCIDTLVCVPGVHPHLFSCLCMDTIHSHELNRRKELSFNVMFLFLIFFIVYVVLSVNDKNKESEIYFVICCMFSPSSRLTVREIPTYLLPLHPSPLSLSCLGAT